MSLKEEDRKTLVILEIERADSNFSEYVGLVEKKYWNTLANRLYYALFHAVSALLIKDGRQVGSHKGAAIRFHQFYVKTGVFSEEEGSFYSQMETLREQSDYNCFFNISESDIKARIEPTRQFIEKIKGLVSE
jgi:uncharacterized protein (UPF0332 family)